jgi:prepilin-type processing-associated H-X9-DG protein
MMRSRWIPCACLGMLWVVVLAGEALAAGGSPVDDLVTRLPEGVVGFVATSGEDALKADFAKTTLGRIWNDPNVQIFCRSIKDLVVSKVQQEADDPNALKQMGTFLDMAQLLVSRPLVIGVATLKAPVRIKDGPPVYAFAILDAGTRKAQFEAMVKKLETLAGADAIADVAIGSARMRGPKAAPLYWGWSGNYLVVAANDAAGLTWQYLQKPRATVPEYLKKVPAAGDALVVHANVQAITSLVDATARQADKVREADTITGVLKELGLSGVKALTARVGFAGPDVVAGSFLEIVGPRTGLLATLKPMDPALLDMVDARAVTADAFDLDVAGAYDAIMRAIRTASPEVYAQVEKRLAGFESEAGLSVRKGLLESLAGPVVFYTLGVDAASGTPGGAALLIKLKNAELFETTLTNLGSYVAARSKGALQVGMQTGEGGRKVYTWTTPQLAMMQITPTWSIAKGYAVIASNQVISERATKQMAARGEGRPSVRDTPGYKAVASRLPDHLVSLRYADSRTQYTQTMTALRQVWPMASMFAMQAGVKLPPTLPALEPIIQDMQPGCRARWLGPDGLYVRYQGPGIEVSLSSVAGVSFGMGVLMPALARVRQLAFRMTSGTNLSGIGGACHFYAANHDDKMPPDLQTLVKEAALAPKALESKRKPRDFAGPSYVYIPGQTTAMNERNVLAYEDPAYCTEGVNVLFLDGHVEFMKPDAFRQALKATYERLGRKMPEIKFKDEGEAVPPVGKPVRASDDDGKCVAVTKTRRWALHTAVNEFHLDTGRWPTREQGLMALVEHRPM